MDTVPVVSEAGAAEEDPESPESSEAAAYAATTITSEATIQTAAAVAAAAEKALRINGELQAVRLRSGSVAEVGRAAGRHPTSHVPGEVVGEQRVLDHEKTPSGSPDIPAVSVSPLAGSMSRNEPVSRSEA
ncbi:hypothetical protein GCM10009839_11300 [Catenulispora yoronensis]|uniref:Uncharacterized protein n=1 Tax=Catenulispora yoronensis TaxID=450799 RepID=A0ABN2TRK7_9ACTN